MKRRLIRLTQIRMPLYLTILISIILGITIWVGVGYLYQTLESQTNVTGIGVGVYWDLNGDNPVRNMFWGNITLRPFQQPATKNITVYVRNEVDGVTTLTMNTTNWQPPPLAEYARLSWNYNGTTLAPKETISLTLTLLVNSDAWGKISRAQPYSFDLTISTKKQ